MKLPYKMIQISKNNIQVKDSVAITHNTQNTEKLKLDHHNHCVSSGIESW